MRDIKKEGRVVRLLNWISKNFSIVQVILLSLTLGVSFLVHLFGAGNTNVVNGCIIALLVFIAIDFIILIKGFLEKITLNISELLYHQEYKINFSKDKPRNMTDKIDNAKNSIFISGTDMTFLHAETERNRYVALANNGVKIIFAISELENEYINTYLERFFNKPRGRRKANDALITDYINQIKNRILKSNKDNLRLIPLDVFIPTAYVAVDYDNKSEHSVIYAKHYILDKDGNKTNCFWLFVYPGTSLYDEYLEQVHTIINYNGKLAARFSTNRDGHSSDSTKMLDVKEAIVATTTRGE
jgi:hypothetical protein